MLRGNIVALKCWIVGAEKCASHYLSYHQVHSVISKTLHCIVLYFTSTMIHWIVLHLHSTALYYNTVSHCTVIYQTAEHCTNSPPPDTSPPATPEGLSPYLSSYKGPSSTVLLILLLFPTPSILLFSISYCTSISFNVCIGLFYQCLVSSVQYLVSSVYCLLSSIQYLVSSVQCKTPLLTYWLQYVGEGYHRPP